MYSFDFALDSTCTTSQEQWLVLFSVLQMRYVRSSRMINARNFSSIDRNHLPWW